MKRSFPAEPDALREVRNFIRERAEEAAIHRGDRDDLVLAVSEVCANAVLHADTSQFVVSWSAGPSEDTEVRISDHGVFGVHGLGRESGSRGYGLPLVAALVDEVSIARGTPARPGTTVRLVKHRGAQAGSEFALARGTSS